MEFTKSFALLEDLQDHGTCGLECLDIYINIVHLVVFPSLVNNFHIMCLNVQQPFLDFG